MTENLKYQIALSLVKGIGPKLARHLIAYVGSETEVFQQKKSQLAKIPGIGNVLVNNLFDPEVMVRAEQEIDFIQKHQIQPLFFTDDAFPQRLSTCDDAPLMLFVKGSPLNEFPIVVSVVGTRKASEEGKINCENFIAELASRYPDTVIVSGLAYGIDICAHRAAVKNGLTTFGVMAHGLDRIYPAMHRDTAKQMLNNGGLITEFLTGTNPDKPNFVRRNRIVAGLCDALVVVESSLKGGAIITARIAHSYNRDVMAYPGTVGNTLSGGGNYLIKKNIAALIEGVDDFEFAMGWERKTKQATVQKQLFLDFKTIEEETLYQLMVNHKEMTANELSIKGNIPVSKVSAGMLSLEFAGLVKCLPGNAFRIL